MYRHDYKFNLFNKRSNYLNILLNNEIVISKRRSSKRKFMLEHLVEVWTFVNRYNFKSNLILLKKNNFFLISLLNDLKFFEKKESYLLNIEKWLLALKFPFSTSNIKKISKDYYKFFFNFRFYKKYKLFYFACSLTTKYKMKIYKKFIPKPNLNFSKKRNGLFFFWKGIKFLWRFQLVINLLLLYMYIYYYNSNNNILSNILLNYLQCQFRVLFSKQEQKALLKLTLKVNKFFIAKTNLIKYNFFNKLIIMQIIITGRWMRKRWVTPFPKYYKSGLVELNKIFKSYKSHYNIYFSYKDKQILTRKGLIGIRLFLFFIDDEW